MLPLVAIDVPPATPAEVATAVTASCNAALGDGECVLSTSPEGARYFATVRWGGPDGTSLRIELRTGWTESAAALDTRVIVFAPADRLRQRWASAGLVVAALVVQREAGEEPSPPPRVMTPSAEPNAPPTRLAAPRETRPVGRSRVSLAAAAVVGPALEGRALRAGPALELAWAPSPVPVGILVGARTQTRPGLPSLTWVAGDVGAIARIGSWDARWSAELHAAATAERLFIVASDPSSGLRDTAARWRGGGRLAAMCGYVVRPPLAVVLGAEVSLLRPEVRIAVAGEPVGADPAVGFSGWFGLRISIPAAGGGGPTGRYSANLPGRGEEVRH